MLPGGRDDIFTLCPYGGGGRNWMATSFNPENAHLFVVAQDVCTDIVPLDAGGFLSTGVNMEIAPRPDSDGRYGLLQAMDMRTGEILWQSRQRSAQTTGVLSTGGGVVFAGNLDRQFIAYDAASGEALWQAGVSDTPNGAPISYAVDGWQYVAMVVGHGSAATNAFTGLSPEVTIPPVRSSAIYVFALPE
jgi:alcohol dehydrogenase (cytochrome c)